MHDKRVIPQNLARLMSPEDRKRLGVRTSQEVEAENNLTLEREVHNQFIGWLHRYNFKWFYHSDPVRRPTILAGLPDFGVYRDSRIIFIEFKIKGNGLSETQEQAFQEMGADGNIILVCYTYSEARKAVSQFFNLPNDHQT